MRVERFRDLSLFEVGDKRFLLACDSTGAIGAKEADVVKVDEEVTGYYLCRVPLIEMLSQGIKPGVGVLTISNEKTPTGERIYQGVAKALKEVGIDPNTILNGSTEENMETIQTGAGITLIGATGEDFEFSSSPAGSLVYALGVPKVGDQVTADKDGMIPLSMVIDLYSDENIYEILPVGSKGCIYEAEEMARTSSLIFQETDELPQWANDSAGPACVVLVSVRQAIDLNHYHIPITFLGTLLNK